MKKWLSLLLLLPTLLMAEPSKEPLLLLGGGVFNIIKYPKRPQFQVEYIFSQGYYKSYPCTIRPFTGMMMNTDRSTFLYGGVRFDLFATKHIVITPSFAPGFYIRGKGRNLHFPLEFRSCMEVSYAFDNHSRLGAQFYHISNASLGSKNPGVESLLLFYAFPLGKIAK